MVEPEEDIASIELHVRELTAHALEAARERAACESAIKKSRETLETGKRQLPEAERDAKERRQAQNDAIRGRAELEHRLAELVEAEDLTRARRQQAEQRSQGFRAAAAFAAAGRQEAESAKDAERVERERLVEERANREAAAAETRAAEELAEETKLGRHRAEIETHVDAERSLEAEIAADRAAGEARVAALKEAIENAAFELHEAEVNLERLDADRERLAQERAIAGERLREVGRRARGEIEARIADLRSKELELVHQREEQERLLASLIANEQPPAPEPEIVQGEHPAEVEATHEDEHAVGRASDADAPEGADSAEPPAPQAHFSTVTFKATPAARDAAAQGPPEPPSGYGPDYRDTQDFRSLIGNIFTRRKPVEDPIDDEGPSVADRIARDFGLLGVSDDEPAAGDEPLAEARAAAQLDASDSLVDAQASHQGDAHGDAQHAALSPASGPQALHADDLPQE